MSSAVGAFLVGIALTGPVADAARKVLAPLRDLFAAVFFVFFGLQTDPASMPPVLLAASGLAVASAAAKLAAGWWAAARTGQGAGCARGRPSLRTASSPSSLPGWRSPAASRHASERWRRAMSCCLRSRGRWRLASRIRSGGDSPGGGRESAR